MQEISSSTALVSSPAQLVDALHVAFGDHHSRAVHAKGIILQGIFTPDPGAAALTKADHLQSTSSAVTVRFSDFTGIPDIPDDAGPANPRGFAIRFLMPDGLSTDIVGHSFNGFPTANSDEFRELLLAIGASGPGIPKPTALDRFLDTHPIAKTFLTTQKTPASYATIAYFGVNSFRFTNSELISNYIRYQFIPVVMEDLPAPDELAGAGPDYLQTEIRARIALRPVQFRMYAQLAQSGDELENPSVAWSDDRKLVLLGIIELKALAPNTDEEDKGLVFNPANLPDGIDAADPMIRFRSRAYPISARERQ